MKENHVWKERRVELPKEAKAVTLHYESGTNLITIMFAVPKPK